MFEDQVTHRYECAGGGVVEKAGIEVRIEFDAAQTTCILYRHQSLNSFYSSECRLTQFFGVRYQSTYLLQMISHLRVALVSDFSRLPARWPLSYVYKRHRIAFNSSVAGSARMASEVGAVRDELSHNVLLLCTKALHQSTTHRWPRRMLRAGRWKLYNRHTPPHINPQLPPHSPGRGWCQ